MTRPDVDAKPIGLLYDSVSPNTGDQAIGIALRDYLVSQCVPVEIVDPYDFDPDDYEFLLIGGGLLLRDPGDPYYDKFRVPGRHALNAMGTSTSRDLDHLRDYRKVSVRSESDKARILAALPDATVHVVPDSTMLLEPVELDGIDIPDGSVGIHVVADTLINCDGLQGLLDGIPEHKVVIPFTHYNYDLRLMALMNVQGDYQFLEELAPRELFTAIGRMKYVIVSSLHATIFAYAQNVPFLTFYQDKVHDYLVDRGLEHLIFRNTEELAQKMHLVTDERPDFSQLIARDAAALKAHLEELVGTHRSAGEAARPRDAQPAPAGDAPYTKESLLLDLHKHVLGQRDRLVHELIVRGDRLRRELANSEDHRREAEGRLREVERRLQQIESTLPYRVAAGVWNGLRLTRRG
jgi:hypothetical protein